MARIISQLSQTMPRRATEEALSTTRDLVSRTSNTVGSMSTSSANSLVYVHHLMHSVGNPMYHIIMQMSQEAR